MPLPLGPIISAGASLLGGLFAKSGADQDRADQLDLAKNSVSYRVADANRAGINPLAALGMSPMSISPTSVGDPGFAAAGQEVGRAVDAGSTESQRLSNLQYRLLESQVTGSELDNDIRRTELVSRVRRSRAAGTASMGLPEVGPNTARGGDVGGQLLPMPFGLSWETGPSATAEEWERQYGDAQQELYGNTRFLDDVPRNLKRVNEWAKPADDAVWRVLSELFGINPAL